MKGIIMGGEASCKHRECVEEGNDASMTITSNASHHIEI